MMMKIMQQRLLLCMVILSLVALAYAVPKLHDDASTHRFNVLRKKIRESGFQCFVLEDVNGIERCVTSPDAISKTEIRHWKEGEEGKREDERKDVKYRAWANKGRNGKHGKYMGHDRHKEFETHKKYRKVMINLGLRKYKNYEKHGMGKEWGVMDNPWDQE